MKHFPSPGGTGAQTPMPPLMPGDLRENPLTTFAWTYQ